MKKNISSKTEREKKRKKPNEFKEFFAEKIMGKMQLINEITFHVKMSVKGMHLD